MPTEIACYVSRSWWRHQIETVSALLVIFESSHQPPMDSPHKSQWRGTLMFSWICVWTNSWANNRGACDLRRYRAHTSLYCEPDLGRTNEKFGQVPRDHVAVIRHRGLADIFETSRHTRDTSLCKSFPTDGELCKYDIVAYIIHQSPFSFACNITYL